MEDEYQRGYDDGYAEAELQCEDSGYGYDDEYRSGYAEAERELGVSPADSLKLERWDELYFAIRDLEGDLYWGEKPISVLDRVRRMLRLMEVE